MNRQESPAGIPRLSRLALKLFVPREKRDFWIGDLDEAFVRRQETTGLAEARRWYRRQVVRSLPYLFKTPRVPVNMTATGLLSGVGADVRFAFRSLRRSPLFTVVALSMLTLGIGFTVALFTIVNAVLLRPPVFDEPSRIVRLFETRERDSDLRNMSYLDIVDVRERSRTLTHVSAKQLWTPTLLGESEPVRLNGASVSANFFTLLGVSPVLGRFFTEAEGVLGHEPVVVLSHHVWVEQFGGDEEVIGRTLDLSGALYRVIGVAPAGFEDPDGHLDAWRARPTYFDTNILSRTGHNMRPLARMAPGVTLAQINEELARISSELLVEYPDEKAGDGIVAVPIVEVLVGSSRASVLTLFGAVCVLLLIASANVANLLLSRATVRRGEIAVRSALGASTGRIVSQLLVESLVLSALGTVLGLALASIGVKLFVTLGAALPRAATISVDYAVVVFAVLTSIVVALLFGLAPALQLASRRRLTDLRGRPGDGTAKQIGFRNGLVVAEVALAITLLTGAGLLLRAWAHLGSVDSGIRPENVLTLNVAPSERRYDSHVDLTRYWEDVTGRVGALPGVEAVGAVSFLPMGGGYEGQGIRRADRPPPSAADRIGTEARAVTPGYFDAIGMTVVAGRGFESRDDSASTPVAVVNRSLARLVFAGEQPLGKTVIVQGIEREIVGVVADVRQFGVLTGSEPEIYAPHAQPFVPWIRSAMDLVVRVDGDPLSIAPSIRQAIWDADPTVPIEDVKSMESWVADDLAAPRVRAYLLGLFAAVALIMAAVGVSAVLVYTVNQRTREFGVRMALGAHTPDLVGLVLRHGAKLILMGVAIGAVASWIMGRLLSTMLYGVSPNDPVAFGVVVLGLLVMGVVAAAVPALRTARVSPGAAIRVD